MKTKIRQAVPVILSFALAIGIILPGLSPDARADTPNTVISTFVEDESIGMISTDETSDPAPEMTVKIWVDSESITLSSRTLLIDSTAYVQLYDFCRIMGPAAMTQDDEKTTIFLPDLQIVAIPENFYIVANGRYLYVPTLCKVFDGIMYVPIRPLAKAFGAVVSWDDSQRTVSVTPTFIPLEHGDSFYDETDVYWLSRIINAEARGESMEGKIAVGNVVMNRVRSSIFPDTVRGVIFDKRSGIQFSPAYSGSINRTPAQESIIAAKLALDDADVVGASMFFNAARLSKTWASRNRTFVTRIGNHNFFA